jgi:hypothetical protein
MWHLASAIWHLASGIWHLASGIWHLASGIWHLASDLWHMIGYCLSIHIPLVRCQIYGDAAMAVVALSPKC